MIGGSIFSFHGAGRGKAILAADESHSSGDSVDEKLRHLDVRFTVRPIPFRPDFVSHMFGELRCKPEINDFIIDSQGGLDF